MARLIDVSIEIIQHIIFFIAYPSDLLSLALTCRAFSLLIIPTEIEYRQIHTTPGYRILWETLTTKHHSARKIRSLHIFEHHKRKTERVIVPRAFRNPPKASESSNESNSDISRVFEDGKELTAFVKALALMKRLRQFSWTVGYDGPFWTKLNTNVK